MNKLILIAALAAAAAAGAPAQSQATRSLRIEVVNLDLSTPEGVRALDRRIFRGAAELCDAPSAADPHGRRDYDRCVSDARAAAAAARDRAVTLRQGGRPILASGQ